MNIIPDKLENRNLVSTIKECLSEHKVMLLGVDKEKTPRYLIEFTLDGTLLNDFLDTYKTELDDFKIKLAKKSIKEQKERQVYGVFIDSGLNFDFAFNRKFADLNRDETQIIFRAAEKIILDNTINSSDVIDSLPSHQDSGHHFNGDGGDMTFRYSLVGKKESDKKESDANDKTRKDVNYGQQSLLDRIREYFSKNEVSLDASNGKKDPITVFKIPVSYFTNTLLDLNRTYPNETDSFKQKIAEVVFGNAKTVKSNNNYELLISKNMQIIFAYNTLFAKYDADKKTVLYTPIEDVLTEQVSGKGISPFQITPPSSVKPKPQSVPQRQGPVLIKYALIGKKGDE